MPRAVARTLAVAKGRFACGTHARIYARGNIMSFAPASTMPFSSEPPALPADRGPAPLAERDALAVGTRLAEFRLLRVLGRGGFGIVYLAHDESLGRQVAIKEYLPALWSGRGLDGRVTVRCSSVAGAFAAGLSSFVDEAQLLARFDHPSLVKVHRFWEANGTAYMVMPYYPGVSLRQLRDSMSDPPTEAWLRRLLGSLLGALDVLHEASVLHRDVAPDNILMSSSGVPVLLDFGAARQVLRGQPQALTAILKPSYAPIEQYAADTEVAQGPWTDIYAVAATLHFALTGEVPCTSAARAVQDTQPLLRQRAARDESGAGSGYDRAWLAALDWGLAVMPQARPQSIAQWQEALAGRSSPPRAEPAARASPAAAARGWLPRGARIGAWATPIVASLALIVGSVWSGRENVAVYGATPAAVPAAALTPQGPVAPALPDAPMPMPMAIPLPTSAPQRTAVATTSVTLAVAAQPTRRLTPRATKKPKPPVSTSPLRLCANVSWFGRANCVRKLCATSAWKRHPQCTVEERVG